MTRRSILCSVLGLAGVPVVKPSVLTLAQKLEYSDIWDDRPASDFCIPPPPGTDCEWNGQEWVGVGLGEHAGPEGPVGPVGAPGPRGNMGIESWEA
jgi:hypothetical protein